MKKTRLQLSHIAAFSFIAFAIPAVGMSSTAEARRIGPSSMHQPSYPGHHSKRRMARLFNKIDRNNNGVISRRELRAQPRRIKRRLRGADRNRNGRITWREFRKAMNPKRFPTPKVRGYQRASVRDHRAAPVRTHHRASIRAR